MLKRLLLAACALAFAATTVAAQTSRPLFEMGIIEKSMGVVNLEKGGKRVVIEGYEVLPEGAPCQIDDEAYVRWQAEEGSKVLVRLVLLSGMQIKKGYCPLDTPFHITKPQWDAAKKRFAAKWDISKWWESVKGLGKK